MRGPCLHAHHLKNAMVLIMHTTTAATAVYIVILGSDVAILQVRKAHCIKPIKYRKYLYFVSSKALPRNCSNGDLRLTDGDSEFNGRVDVCYGNQWGTVCGDNSWTSDTSGASTVCKQLGYSPINATPFELSLPRSGSHYLLLSAVHCDARVTRLIDCFHDPFNSSYCSYGAAGVSCKGNQVHF